MQHGIQTLRRGLIPLLIIVLCLAACGEEPAEIEKTGKDKTKAATEATAAGTSASAGSESRPPAEETTEIPETAAPTKPSAASPTDPPTEPAATEPRIALAEELPDYATNCYTLKTFYDSRYGLKTAQVLVPYGWNVEVNVE